LANIINLVRYEKNIIELELKDGDQTIANLIAKYAIKRSDVAYSSYIVPHPLKKDIKIVITTSGEKDPLQVVKEILKSIAGDASTFLSLFETVMKKGEACEERK